MVENGTRTRVFIFLVAVFLSFFGTGSAIAADGKALYEKTCKVCHAVDGTGNAKLAETLKIDLAKLNLVDAETAGKSDAKLVRTVLEGVASTTMKPNKDKMTVDEASVVVKYIRSLKK